MASEREQAISDLIQTNEALRESNRVLAASLKILSDQTVEQANAVSEFLHRQVIAPAEAAVTAVKARAANQNELSELEGLLHEHGAPGRA